MISILTTEVEMVQLLLAHPLIDVNQALILKNDFFNSISYEILILFYILLSNTA